MTSREHARRLMLILLSSDGRLGGGDAAAESDEDAGRDRGAGTGEGRDHAQDRGHPALTAGLTRM